MAEEPRAAVEPHVADMFDAEARHGLVCRVCGSVVADVGDYPS